MNFLDNFVIPSSVEHAALLNILQILTMLIFLPFTGMVLGGSLLSLIFNSKGIKEDNPIYTRFAKDIMDKILVTRSSGLAFGVMPVAIVTIIFAQFLMNAQGFTVNFLAFSVLYYFAAIIFLYKYKISFLKYIPHSELLIKLRLARRKVQTPENEEFIPSLSGYAYLGIIALLVGLFLLVCGATVVTEPGMGSASGIFKSLFSFPIWMNFIYLILASLAISGSAILYFFFVWQGGLKNMSEEYINLVKKAVVPPTLISTILLPLFLFGGIVLLPAASLSASVYMYVLFTFISILIVCNLLYGIFKNSRVNYAGAVFFIMFLIFMFSVVKDQLVLGNSVKDHLYVVNLKAEEYNKQFEPRVAADTVVNPEQIFNTKCIACHKFDAKLVGPPYKETVPKYNGDVQKLAGFIYNPIKVNPEYPAMPNQGLKQKEAEAMAKWLIEKVKQ